MTNPFAILGLPESLLIDSSGVEGAWQSLTRAASADGEGEAAARNEARAVLSDPVSRLGAWLKIRNPGAAPDRAIDPALMDLFAKIGPTLASTDALLARHRQAGTVLARAVLAKEAVAAQLAVQELLREVQALKKTLTDRYPEFEAAAVDGNFDEAGRALGQLKFLRRWEEQCRERLLALLAT